MWRKKIKPNEIRRLIAKQLSIRDLKGITEKWPWKTNGVVFQVGDGIARIYGLNNVKRGELLEFLPRAAMNSDEEFFLKIIISISFEHVSYLGESISGIALNLEANNIGAVLLGEGRNIGEGTLV